MPQTHERGPSASALRQGLGYIPPRGTVAASGGGLVVTDGPTQEISLDASGVTPTVYGDGTNVAQIEVDSFGRVVDAADVPITFPAPPSVGVHSVTFGAGVPGGTPAEGDLYFDTTLATYVGYVGHSGIWHQF